MEISNWFLKLDFGAKHFLENWCKDADWPSFKGWVSTSQNGDFQAKYGLLEYWIEEEFCQSKNKNDFQQNCEIAKASVWHLILGVT